MTPAQKNRYWRDWSRVRKVLVDLGEFSKDDADAQRKIIQAEALGGVEKSSKELTNRDLDKVFRAFAAILVMVDGPRSGPVEDQPRKRLLFAIDKLGLPEPYIVAIARDQFQRDDWRNLPLASLEKFRYTLTARAASRKRNAEPS